VAMVANWEWEGAIAPFSFYVAPPLDLLQNGSSRGIQNKKKGIKIIIADLANLHWFPLWRKQSRDYFNDHHL